MAPFPAEGQSNDDIQRLVEANADVPLFVILLQNPERTIPGYDRFINFWRHMQLHHSFVWSYPVNGTAEIERTYDEVVARLQNTVTRPPVALAPGQTLEVFISQYVQRLVVSVTHERGRPPAEVQIRDSHADDKRTLIYGHDRSHYTSFSSVRIIAGGEKTQGVPLAGNVEQAPQVDGQTVTTKVEQLLSFADNPFTNRPDTFRIATTVSNAGSATPRVGVRMMLDTMIGGNDDAPFFWQVPVTSPRNVSTPLRTCLRTLSRQPITRPTA